MKAAVLTIGYSGKTLSVKVTKKNKEYLDNLFSYLNIEEKEYEKLVTSEEDRQKIKDRLDGYKNGKGKFYSVDEAKKLLAK